jgi:hypothetical protein
MLEHKSISDSKEKMRPSAPTAKNFRLQQLQDEIDKLALLVNEAKRQSDKIQAAADALGDSVFGELESSMVTMLGSEKRSRSRKTEN